MRYAVQAPRLEFGLDHGLVPVPNPRISWVIDTDHQGWMQHGAEVRLTLDDSASEIARLDGADSVFVEWPFEPLSPRDAGVVEVRVLGVHGWSDWSPPTTFLASFMGAHEWRARFIEMPAPQRHAAPGNFRTTFEVREGLKRALWYGTAQGAYQAWINGSGMDDQILKPGWTSYQFRLVHDTADVTDLVKQGTNAVGIALSGAWFTEKYGFSGRAAPVYGEQPAVAGQILLEYRDGSSEWIITGDDWLCSEGAWIEAGIYDGEVYDARRWDGGWAHPSFDASGWARPKLREVAIVPEPRNSPVVRVTETRPVEEVLSSPTGALILDFGQNLVGRLRIRVKGLEGDVITLRHAEVLDEGELGVRPLRTARATDTYILRGEPAGEEYAPTFSFHGFRYAEIAGWPGEFDPSSVEAEVVGSDMVRTGWFDCSDALVNRLHENVVWGMRGNFLYIPTDCPQRDERLGWTGDIQIFAPTASFLYDCNSFLSAWLKDLALEQEAAGGGVPFTVPDVLRTGHIPAAAWGDAATVVPWTMYERFGDVDTLATQYESMKAWADLIWSLSDDHLWEGGFQFGDWVDPDAPPEEPSRAKADAGLIASAFLYLSTHLVARSAAVLGHGQDCTHYSDRAERVRQAWLKTYVTPAGRIMSDAQTAYAVAITFGIVRGEVAKLVGDRLAWLVRRDGYRISTGFVGTPLVSDALTRSGHVEKAGRMLLQTECPSWLYSVTMGATTVWERWDSLLPDGSINPGEMTSFNHYALGSVADWMYREVVGISPTEPGFQRILIAPKFIRGLVHATGRFRSPYGDIKVHWERRGDQVLVQATVPPNVQASVELPGCGAMFVGSGQHSWNITHTQASGAIQLELSTPLADIIDDPVAYQRVLATFAAISPEAGDEFRRRTKWVPNQTLSDSLALVSKGAAQQVMEELGLTMEVS